MWLSCQTDQAQQHHCSYLLHLTTEDENHTENNDNSFGSCSRNLPLIRQTELIEWKGKLGWRMLPVFWWQTLFVCFVVCYHERLHEQHCNPSNVAALPPAVGRAGAAHLFEIIQGDGVKREVGQRHFLTSVCIDLTMCHFYDKGLHFHCGPLLACNLQITCFHPAEWVYWQGMRTSWHQASNTVRNACVHSRWMDDGRWDYDKPAGATRKEE